jgi:drug/metabolite transporter (DMT)-like permease
MSSRYAIPMSLYYYGLQDTTASYAFIFLNLIPLTTFTCSGTTSLYFYENTPLMLIVLNNI